jgi:hypothetical protein
VKTNDRKIQEAIKKVGTISESKIEDLPLVLKRISTVFKDKYRDENISATKKRLELLILDWEFFSDKKGILQDILDSWPEG